MASNDVKDMSEDIGGESTSSDDDQTDSDDMGSWVSWFCGMKGNEFFCEVDEDYIQDDFNLSGLSSQVPYYDYALEVILDADSFQDEMLTEAQQAAVEAAAETLYGLIHARFILTSRGLAAMADKFRSCDFGRCPRVLCNGQPCLPVGLSDIPRQSTVKLFCPRCEDAFYPRSKYHGNIDGAYFGTTFPHLFCLTYPSLKPQKPPEKYVPKVFGFKISPLAFNRQQADGTRNNNNGAGGSNNNNNSKSRQGANVASTPTNGAIGDTPSKDNTTTNNTNNNNQQQHTTTKSNKKSDNNTSSLQKGTVNDVDDNNTSSRSMKDVTDASHSVSKGKSGSEAGNRKKSKK